MKVRTMVNSVESLNQLLNCNMNAKSAMRVGITIKRLEEHVTAFKEQEIKLYQKYGKETQTDQGQGWILNSKEDGKKLQDELNELLDDEISVDVLQISINDVISEVTPKTLISLDWLFHDIEDI